MSSRWIGSTSFLMSYQVAWSTSCRSNSKGGWVPNASVCGRLRSSTKSTHRLPTGGPYTPGKHKGTESDAYSQDAYGWLFNARQSTSFRYIFTVIPWQNGISYWHTGSRWLTTTFAYNRLVVNRSGHKLDNIKLPKNISLYTLYCTVTPIKYWSGLW